ncbi:MAG TPA: M13 family metallopeptidase [Gemmatimonadales bacterium]|nr:M13 family metallopeptidase [Gemmatimonadales bacterium]
MKRLLTALALATLPAVASAQSGVNRAYIDTTCAPCRDFFTYANGAWLKTATIPAAYTSAGASRELIDRNLEALRRVLDGAAAGADTARDPTTRKLGVFYASCMDSVRVERAGASPITGEVQRIAILKTRAEITTAIARLHRLEIPALFHVVAEIDPKQSSRVIAQLYQAGLGLPDRDYYRKTDPGSDSLRREYVVHIARTFMLLGAAPTDARSDAEAVLRLETALADSSMTRVAQRDPQAVYHRMTLRELRALAPAIDWPRYFDELGVPALKSDTAQLDVSQPAFLRQVNDRVAQAPLADWRAYLRWHLVRQAAPSLSAAFFAESFAFDSRLRGAKAPMPRWKRCAAASDDALGEALGKAYVEREFPPASKARVLEIVNNLQAAFAERIKHLAWMSDSTKAQALTKLSAVLKKIGYPDTWRDYSALTVNATAPYATNLLAARAFEQQRELAKIGKPADRGEWQMTPPTVNAYYSPTTNEITFPAGILAPPYFDPSVDDAVNYGGIGAVIGHELTHGFDDEGRQYDAAGNLRDWWTPEDASRFTARARSVVAQYNGYVAVDTFHVNGELTLGENLADLGGLEIAYDAFQRSLAGKPRPPAIDGFTPEQRFFLGFAQGWRSLMRPETLKVRTLTNPHSPPQWRVNGSVSFSPEFARAFSCHAGDAMARPDSLGPAVW